MDDGDEGFMSWRDLGFSSEQLARRIKTMSREECLRVKELDISENGLTEVPRCVAKRFPNLEVLRLNGNKLTSLPDELARLDKLIWLLIHDNPELDAFPSCYVALRSLTRCLTHGNPELRDPIMRRCLGRDVSKLIARLVWLSRGSARVWTRCMPLDVQPYYLHRNAF
jgi:hypothetical protein